MDGDEFEAHLGPYMEWRVACQRYARHLDAGMYGGDCLATDSHGGVWMFAFRPAEEGEEMQVVDRPSEGAGGRTATEHGCEQDDKIHRTESHRTVNIQVGDIQAEIDEQIAPLIRELWRAGIETFGFWRDAETGSVQVEFATSIDAQMFLDVVAEYDDDPDGLYARITGRWDGFAGSPPPWEYDTHPEDLALVVEYLDDDHDDEAGEWHAGDSDFLFPISVRFPASDYPAVLARLIRHNECREKHSRPTDAPVGGQAGEQASGLVVAGPAGEAGTVPGPSGAG